MLTAKRKRERLVVLLVAGAVAFNYPLLSLFNRIALWMGFPVLYLYLFVVWILLIGLVAAVMEKHEPGPSSSKASEPGK